MPELLLVVELGWLRFPAQRRGRGPGDVCWLTGERPAALAGLQTPHRCRRPRMVPRRSQTTASGPPVCHRAGRSSLVGAFLRLAESRRRCRVVFMAVVLTLLAVALIDQWGTLRHEAQALSLPVLTLSFWPGWRRWAAAMVWRNALADLGSHLSLGDACRIMFDRPTRRIRPWQRLARLGQMESGAQRDVPRGRSAVSLVVSAADHGVHGGLVAAITLVIGAVGPRSDTCGSFSLSRRA